MRILHWVPVPLRIVSGVILTMVLTLLMSALWSRGERTSYELIKDILIPLIGPLVAVMVPVLLFFWLPMSQNKQRLAMEFFTLYHSEEMRKSRNLGWKYFVSERRGLSADAQQDRLDLFLKYLMEPESSRTVSWDLDEIYQKTLRVLDYFAMVDECLERNTVDEGMVRSFITFYFLQWYDEVVQPLESRPMKPPENLRFVPVWWNSFLELQRISRTQSGTG